MSRVFLKDDRSAYKEYIPMIGRELSIVYHADTYHIVMYIIWWEFNFCAYMIMKSNPMKIKAQKIRSTKIIPLYHNSTLMLPWHKSTEYLCRPVYSLSVNRDKQKRGLTYNIKEYLTLVPLHHQVCEIDYRLFSVLYRLTFFVL